MRIFTAECMDEDGGILRFPFPAVDEPTAAAVCELGGWDLIGEVAESGEVVESEEIAHAMAEADSATVH